jgi:transcriptional regulator with PAS, ATPase and Fis domain
LKESTASSGSKFCLVRATISVTTGPNSGATVELGADGVSIGRSPSCDIQLNDPLVSLEHVQLSATPEGVRVLDLNSRNGTYHGSARVRTAVFTRSGVLTVGTTAIAVTVQGPGIELPISDRTSFGPAIGHSFAMRSVFYKLEQAARTRATVLLEGHSGTGKDVLATAVHEESERRDAPFIVVDCGSLPENLIESELFGHERGAFTGASAQRAGAFELAHTGTLFLDEIGELPIELQPKLLRVLETQKFRRVGGNRTIDVDVRVVAATNRNLTQAVRERQFREDLYYRLAVVRVHVPRLADRPEDIGPLAEAFFRRATGDSSATVPEELLAILTAHDWPGNARELRNAVERFVTLGTVHSDPVIPVSSPYDNGGNLIDISLIDRLPYHEAKRQLMEAFHESYLPQVLSRAGGSVTRAAELLDIPRGSVSRMLSSLKRGKPQ